jgi:hypothetical protein
LRENIGARTLELTEPEAHTRIDAMSALAEAEDNEGRRATSQAIVLLCLLSFKRTTMLEAKATL